jgi:hypothetical protein
MLAIYSGRHIHTIGNKRTGLKHELLPCAFTSAHNLAQTIVFVRVRPLTNNQQYPYKTSPYFQPNLPNNITPRRNPNDYSFSDMRRKWVNAEEINMCFVID